MYSSRSNITYVDDLSAFLTMIASLCSNEYATSFNWGVRSALLELLHLTFVVSACSSCWISSLIVIFSS